MDEISMKILAGFLVFLVGLLLGYHSIAWYRRSQGKRCEQCKHYHKAPYDEVCVLGEIIDEPIPAIRTCFSFADAIPVKKYNNTEVM